MLQRLTSIVRTVQRRNAWSRRWIAIRTTCTAVSQEAPSHGHTQLPLHAD